MKYRKVISFLGLSFLLSSSYVFAQSNSSDIKRQLKNFVDNKIAEKVSDPLAPDWLKRVELEWDLNSEVKPEYNILTLQPLLQSEDKKHTFFTQGRIAHNADDRTTGNLGFGYRNLAFEQRVIFGLNSFFDYEFPYDHQRAGAGIELISNAFELRGNYYKALSGWHSTTYNMEERALDGRDVELGTQLPYLPWAYIFAKHFYWDGVQDIRGNNFNLRLRPTPAFEVELGHSDDDRTKAANYAEIRYRINWGGSRARKRKERFVADTPFNLAGTVEDKLLEKVRRQNNIRVERRSKTSSGAGTVTVSVARGT